MKTIFLVLALALYVSAGALSPEAKEKIGGYAKACKEEIKITDELMEKIRTGDFTSDDESAKKFTYCLMHKGGIVNDEGIVQKDVVLKKYDTKLKPEVGEAIDACAALNKGTDKYERAYNHIRCYHEKRPKAEYF